VTNGNKLPCVIKSSNEDEVFIGAKLVNINVSLYFSNLLLIKTFKSDISILLN
jgi:hypothetical protein